MTGSATATAGVTGFMPTGWLFNVANSGGATVEASKSTDSDGFDQEVIRISGTPTAGSKSITFQVSTNTTALLNQVAAGDYVRTAARIKLDSNPVGFRSFTLAAIVQGNDGTARNNTGASFSGSNDWPSTVAAFDAPSISQRALVHAAWATMTARFLTKSVTLNYTGGAPMDFTIRTSRMAMNRIDH
jgi:hypothetical protein